MGRHSGERVAGPAWDTLEAWVRERARGVIQRWRRSRNAGPGEVGAAGGGGRASEVPQRLRQAAPAGHELGDGRGGAAPGEVDGGARGVEPAPAGGPEARVRVGGRNLRKRAGLEKDKAVLPVVVGAISDGDEGGAGGCAGLPSNRPLGRHT